MSDSKHCAICTETVWFGAYGVSKEYKEYDPFTFICNECIILLRKMPIIEKEKE